LVDEAYVKMIETAYENRQEANWFSDLLQKLNQLHSLLASEEDLIQTKSGLFQQQNLAQPPRLNLFPLKIILKTVLHQDGQYLSDETLAQAFSSQCDFSLTEHQPGWIIKFILN
jgi:hypothetical protein